MIRRARFVSLLVAFAAAIPLAGCGGSGGGAPAPTAHTVTLSWAPNRESGVNRAGGGYELSVSGTLADGRPYAGTIDVPYLSGSAAPTSTMLSGMLSGSYTATVRAYAALDPSGGSARHYSAPSAPISIAVP